MLSSPGLMHTTVSVLELPPRESERRCVSLELRKGMCFFLADSARKTSERAERLLLMFWASRRLEPVTPERATFSEPARSTRCSLPKYLAPVFLFSELTSSENTQCERELRSWIPVLALALFFMPTATMLAANFAF